jgi:thioredoxin-dependent peroxiredoxin
MVDLPKATKGRRMSKESRKKSSKRSTGRSTERPVKRSAAASRSDTTGAGTKVGRSLAASKGAAKRVKPPAAGARSAESGAGPTLQEGVTAPNFTLPRDGGGTVRLADYAGRKLVLFFYPRANTPGCTREAIDFSRLEKDFATSGTAVLGVSADTVKAQDGFRDKHQLTVPLLSDTTREMLEAYEAWGEKSLYGRKFLGIIRSTVLIGTDGRIAKIWRNVKVDGHAEAVLAAARSLS